MEGVDVSYNMEDGTENCGVLAYTNIYLGLDIFDRESRFSLIKKRANKCD